MDIMLPCVCLIISKTEAGKLSNQLETNCDCEQFARCTVKQTHVIYYLDEAPKCGRAPQIERSERWSSTPMRFPSKSMRGWRCHDERYGSYIRFRNRENIPLNETLRLRSYFSPRSCSPDCSYVSRTGYKRRARYYNPQITRSRSSSSLIPPFRPGPTATRANVPVQDRWIMRPLVKERDRPLVLFLQHVERETSWNFRDMHQRKGCYCQLFSFKTVVETNGREDWLIIDKELSILEKKIMKSPILSLPYFSNAFGLLPLLCVLVKRENELETRDK